MPKRHGKDIIQETPGVSEQERKIVSDITRRMCQKFDEEQGLDKQKKLDLVNEAYKKMIDKETDRHVKNLASVHGEDRAATIERNQYGKQYLDNLQRIENVKEELTKGILEE